MPETETSAAGAMEVRIFADEDSLARAAADQARTVLRTALREHGVAHAMFATGNSQFRFVDALVELPDIDWSAIEVYHMDEYVGLGTDHPASFCRWITERIVERVHPRAAHLFDGTADPRAECERYSALLEASTLDLCCLGIGENGHLAFNDPGVADFADPERVKVVELDEACRLQQVHEGHFPSITDVPREAMTVTIPALLGARRVLAVVPERRKAEPVRAAMEGPIAPSCPASALRQTPHAILYLDRTSAGLLQHR
ncbi:MAG: glucosamine-6-phosphate deaminase [Actinomycetota bacterium]|jgi:glucosamine-6-phosphate deaminase|nr:glucosamine-6-phosphate deaminase [Actinomycetota bacterium]